jgi:hypothetical protein
MDEDEDEKEDEEEEIEEDGTAPATCNAATLGAPRHTSL